MPRQAAAASGFAASTARPLLKPPPDLNLWKKRPSSTSFWALQPTHFLPSDLPLIAAYAKAIVQEKIAAGELALAYVVDGKPSPWLPVWQASIRAVTTLARMLALSSRRSRAVESTRGAGARELLFSTRSGIETR